eukprot:TRINITY_DN240_c4_g1_i3.p1 TRINITY_DN240_c4_g1~~TRINITY_DN240_c4_g1_i3.p1  ORF type:complete len:763 (+),score=93.34 TRINITY_DN240_c4_g1_i3:41-2329(+)
MVLVYLLLFTNSIFLWALWYTWKYKIPSNQTNVSTTDPKSTPALDQHKNKELIDKDRTDNNEKNIDQVSVRDKEKLLERYLKIRSMGMELNKEIDQFRQEIIPSAYHEYYDPRLHVLDDFKIPLWIYDIHAKRFVYANHSALQIWSCASLGDFQKKDLSGNSEATEKANYHMAKTWETEPNRLFEHYWTFYPGGKAVALNAVCSPYKFPSGRLGFYVLGLTPSNVANKTRTRLLRSFECLRHSSSMHTIYTLHGKLVFQNPSAEQKLGLSEMTESEQKTEIQIMNQLIQQIQQKKKESEQNTQSENKSESGLGKGSGGTSSGSGTSNTLSSGSGGKTKSDDMSQLIDIDASTFLPYVTSRHLIQDIVLAIKNENLPFSVQVKVQLQGKAGFHMLTAYSIKDPETGHSMLLITEDDVTALVQQRQKLRQEELTRKELMKAKQKGDAFLSAMTHEIRTPLHGIIGLTQALLDPRHSLTGEPLRLAKNISSSGEHLLTLINNTLDISKLEAERLQISNVKFNPYIRIKQVIDWLYPMAVEKGLYINTFIPINLPHIMGDPSRLGQILLNLVSNALKFTSQGGVELSVHLSSQMTHRDYISGSNSKEFFLVSKKKKSSLPENLKQSELTTISGEDPLFIDPSISINLKRRSRGTVSSSNGVFRQKSPSLSCSYSCDDTSFLGPKYIHFCVTDTGIGIANEDLDKLFERFSQLGTGYTRYYEGTGLGLNICKELTMLMGGAIGVRSQVGVGSTFWLSLPFNPAKDCK